MSLGAIVLAAVVAAATSVHFPVSTADSQTQAAIDRGLFLYYAYDGGVAARSFAQAAARDPTLAMAYWGIALAHGPDLNTPETAARFELAQRAIARAVALSTTASPDERRYVTIMSRRFSGTFADWPKDDAAYRLAMLAFAQSALDENAQMLAAEALLEHGGLGWQDGMLATDESRQALELVEGVLRNDPSSVMANHLCIHLYDLAPDRGPALQCARRLDAAVFDPPAEHLAHMPAHFWIETGDYAAALASSERAYALLMKLDGTAGGSEHVEQYLKHDVAVAYAAALTRGSYAVAGLWSRRMGSAFDTRFDALTALRFGRYADAVASTGLQFGNPSVRGLALLHLGDGAQARAIARPLLAGGQTKGYLPALFLARIAEADGNVAAARERLAQAASEQRVHFGAELIPSIPAGEALGFFDLRHGSNADAVADFTATLALYPKDPRATYGLALALAANGERARAAEARARFESEWEGADTTLAGADFP